MGFTLSSLVEPYRVQVCAKIHNILIINGRSRAQCVKHQCIGIFSNFNNFSHIGKVKYQNSVATFGGTTFFECVYRVVENFIHKWPRSSDDLELLSAAGQKKTMMQHTSHHLYSS